MDLSSIVTFLGGVAFSGLWRRLQSARRERGLPGFEDLVPYLGILPTGEVLLKDGSLLRVWRYRAKARASLELAEREALVKGLAAALNGFDQGFCLHFDVIRRKGDAYLADPGMRDPVSWLVDQEGRQRFSEGWYDTELYLAVSFLPEQERLLRVFSFFEQGRRSSAEEKGFGKLVGAFAERMEELEGRLGGILTLERLEGESLASYLLECVAGLRQKVLVKEGDPLEGLLGCVDLSTGARPIVGEQHLRVVSIVGFPAATSEGLLERLTALGERYRFTLRFLPQSPAAASWQMAGIQNLHRMGVFNPLDLFSSASRTNRTEAEMRDDDAFANAGPRQKSWEVGEARAMASAGQVRFGALNGFVVLMDREEATVEAQAKRLVKVLQDLGFVGRVEGLNTIEAWRASWPGMSGPMVQRPMLHTVNLAHLVALTAYWSGRHNNPSSFFPAGSPPLAWVRTADGGSVFRLNLHSGDVGHFLALGATGAGKSVLIAFLATMFAHRYQDQGSQVLLLDFDHSNFLLTQAVGGAHYHVVPGGDLSFQPLRGVDREQERAWAQGWLTGLLTVALGRALSTVEVERLHEALGSVATEPIEERTLSGLKALLQDEGLARTLGLFCAGGVLGNLLDGGEDRLVSHRWQTFELRELAKMEAQYSGPVIAYLIHRLDSFLEAGRPTLFLADEAWNLLTHPVWRGELKRWMVTARKKNTAIGLVTQSADQMSEDGERLLRLLRDQVANVILLPNQEAKAGGSYAALGLGEQELELLRKAQPKRDYYVRGRDGRQMIHLDLGAVALAFFGSPGVGVAQEVARLKAEHGERWRSVWLLERGLEEAARVLEGLVRKAA